MYYHTLCLKEVLILTFLRIFIEVFFLSLGGMSLQQCGTGKKWNHADEDTPGSLAVEENNLSTLSLEQPHLFVSGLNSLPYLTSFSLAYNEKLLLPVTKISLYLAVQFLFLLIRVFKRQRLKKVGKLIQVTLNETE